MIGADDGDIEVDGGKSGAVSALSSNGRLKMKLLVVKIKQS